MAIELRVRNDMLKLHSSNVLNTHRHTKPNNVYNTFVLIHATHSNESALKGGPENETHSMQVCF